MNAKATLTVRLIGGQVQLTCACGLTLLLPVRAPIAERCPRCERPWR